LATDRLGCLIIEGIIGGYERLIMSEVWIGLSDAIAALRSELMMAMVAGQGETLHFELGPVELEFAVDVRKDGEGNAGIRWGVISFGAKGSVGSSVGHRVKLVLQPKDLSTGRTPEVGSARRQ
jgi:hypothetical protein